MTLQGKNRPERPPQTRTQKIVQWSIYGVAAVLLVIAIVVFISSGTHLF
ncbi:hypothetical protein [Galbitalea soli]|uniref:Uncharacterized protein n=1 Tax=Galbitalea soli TaxID=1268042 RepID=A0A7C9PLA3_9MICO|nr:hypothetical protein [Galbitalea soli]NEM89908.1 hypothetical protein [Galbitalea soli]NYJ30612.1 hypothetical protein [Galbitalea soli]